MAMAYGYSCLHPNGGPDPSHSQNGLGLPWRLGHGKVNPSGNHTQDVLLVSLFQPPGNLTAIVDYHKMEMFNQFCQIDSNSTGRLILTHRSTSVTQSWPGHFFWNFGVRNSWQPGRKPIRRYRVDCWTEPHPLKSSSGCPVSSLLLWSFSPATPPQCWLNHVEFRVLVGEIHINHRSYILSTWNP